MSEFLFRRKPRPVPARLLFLLSEPPYPAHRNGLALINYHLLRQLPGNWTVDIIAAGDEPVDVEAMRRELPAIDRFTTLSSVQSPLDTLATGLHPLLAGLFGGPAEVLADRAFPGTRYDLIYAAPLTSAPRARSALPVFINAVDSYSLLNARFDALAPSWRYRVRTAIYQHYERYFLKAAGGVSFVSDVDADHVRQHCGLTTVTAIANGVDLDLFRDRRIPREAGTLLFTGNFAYEPNRDAAVHLARDILPLARATDPDLRLVIAGKNPPAELTGCDGVSLTGFVDDLAAWYNRSAIFVCPLRSGAGIKNKVLEAMACGIPIVCSTIASDGLGGSEAGREYLVADDAASFAAAIVRLHRDPALQRSLTSAGSALVHENYHWEAAANQYFDRFDAIMARRPGDAA